MLYMKTAPTIQSVMDGLCGLPRDNVAARAALRKLRADGMEIGLEPFPLLRDGDIVVASEKRSPLFDVEETARNARAFVMAQAYNRADNITRREMRRELGSAARILARAYREFQRRDAFLSGHGWVRRFGPYTETWMQLASAGSLDAACQYGFDRLALRKPQDLREAAEVAKRSDASRADVHAWRRHMVDLYACGLGGIESRLRIIASGDRPLQPRPRVRVYEPRRNVA